MSLDRFIEIGCQTEILNDTFDDKVILGLIKGILLNPLLK
jgi:hypothetical protein